MAHRRTVNYIFSQHLNTKIRYQLQSSIQSNLQNHTRIRCLSSKIKDSWDIDIGNNSSSFNTSNKSANQNRDDANTPTSNRSLFRSIPVHPSILEHIRNIGVGLKPKKTKPKKKPQRKSKFHDLLDENDEHAFFSDRGLNRRNRSRSKKNTENNSSRRDNNIFPPPPFSAQRIHGYDDVTDDGWNIKRLPVRILGSVETDEDRIPKFNTNVVALIGRSNVGKSTLLNVSRMVHISLMHHMYILIFE